MPIVNVAKDRCEVFVGITGHNHDQFGSPFWHKKHPLVKRVLPTREECLIAYEMWLDGEAFEDVEPARREWILANLKNLKGKVIGDNSYPRPSHAQILERKASQI